MMKHDCGVAEIEYENSQGFADFHSLRTTYINALRILQVQDSVRVKMARHGDIKTTRGSYDSIEFGEMRSAVEKLAKLSW